MAPGAERARGAAAAKPQSRVREYVEAALWALLLWLFVRTFVVEAFRIPSASMERTLLVGDFLFVNKFEYGAKIPFTHVRLPGLRAPRRGDVIVFQYPPDPGKDYIKRCVATGGDTVEIRDKRLWVNGQPRPELDAHVQHIDPNLQPCDADARAYPGDPALGRCRDQFGPFRVPPGHLFMLGDNRDNSADSRMWGTVPMDLVKGRAMFLYWSWDGSRHAPRWHRLFRPIP